MQVVRRRLADGIHGMTDGKTIYVDDRLSAPQQWCAIQHEMVHADMGHSTHQPDEVEMVVRYETARRCLPVADMVGACRGDVELSARSLRVTKQVLIDRAATLSYDEAVAVGCPECRACPAMAYRFAPAVVPESLTLGA